MKKLIFLFNLVLLLACKQSTRTTNYEGGPPAEAELVESRVMMAPHPGDKDAVGSSSIPPPERSRKLVKSGEISFESQDIKSTKNQILQSVRLYKGYVSEEGETGYENARKEYSLTVKIPAQHFDRFLDKISGMTSRITSKNIRVEDVSSRYFDRETRLRNKKQLETRYLQLLNKASTIADILKIENKLSEIRADIESAEGEFLLLKEQVAYSTLTLTYFLAESKIDQKPPLASSLREALGKGISDLYDVLLWLLSVWPFALIILAAAFIAIKRRRKAKFGSIGNIPAGDKEGSLPTT